MSVIAVPGFLVKTVTVVKGSTEESVGKIKVVLEAKKDDMTVTERHPAGGRTIVDGDILGAMNRHQSQPEPVALRLRFGDNTFLPITGFNVRNISLSPGTTEGERGKMKLVLEAEKDQVRAADNDITSILGQLSMHNSTGETVSLQLRFT